MTGTSVFFHAQVCYSCLNLRAVAFWPVPSGRKRPQLVEMWSVCSFLLSARLLGDWSGPQRASFPSCCRRWGCGPLHAGGSWASVSITEQPEHLSLGFWAARESWLINWFPGREPMLCMSILLGLMPTIVWLLKSPFRGWKCPMLWWHRWALFFNANMKGDLAEFWKRLHHLDVLFWF